MHENELPFVNGGEPVSWAPDIPILVSLGVILGTLVVTAVASLLSPRGRAIARGKGDPAADASEQDATTEERESRSGA
jgi:tellurite resistance protein TerC